MSAQLAVLVGAMCLLAFVIGPRPRPVREAEHWNRIALVAFTVSAVGWSVALLALLVGLVSS